ncbi:hypothetical protein M153_2350003324 [Pseudoloma neurophilia]|uniref:Uncharacterized protein n=1 Tax=Pseudoloma neurophilia TaxID=146866 RepID=A0A0R0LZ05_9MICR|nr:hypothetical protein M153_2350003324 [Pseudoloma neurophilia]
MAHLDHGRIEVLLSEFKDLPSKNDELLDFFEEQFLNKIKTSHIDSNAVDNLISYIKVYKSIKFHKPDELIDKFLNKKVLEFRAMALDILNEDYHAYDADFTLRNPDTWIKELVNEIIAMFFKVTDSNKSHEQQNQESNLKIMPDDEFDNMKYQIRLDLLQKLVNLFQKDSIEVFIGHQKFKQPGNQLVLNYIYFREILSKYVQIDNKLIDLLYENIEIKHRIDFQKIWQFWKENKR